MNGRMYACVCVCFVVVVVVVVVVVIVIVIVVIVIISYNTIKTWIQGGNTQKPLGPTLHMVAAAQAGILTLVMTNPIWVVKTRLCLQYSDIDKTRLPESKHYLGMMDALSKIYYSEGIRGLYKVCHSVGVFDMSLCHTFQVLLSKLYCITSTVRNLAVFCKE